MKKQFLIIPAFLLLIFTSCERYYNPGQNIKTVQEDTAKFASEFEALMRFLPNSGDYINSKNAPSFITAEEVNEQISRLLIVDIRDQQSYVEGHINGAIYVPTDSLFNHFEYNVAANTFDKVVIVDHTGQEAAYVTAILRIIGYDNVFAMKYGMGAWNKSLDQWSANVSNKYASKLETKHNIKSKVYPFPKINTKAGCGSEILQARAKTLLKTPFSKLLIGVDRAFTDSSFYIVNYWPKDKYDKGHIPGSYQYTPKEDLKMAGLLKTLPHEQKILVYCFTGQSAAFLVAYLRLLGYNAFSLNFGANSFMHSDLKAREGWSGFDAAASLFDFPLIKGKNPTDKAFEVHVNEANKGVESKKAPIKGAGKKKEVGGGCG